MPKSSKKQIDKDEKKIINELQKNAKESIDKIAKRCKFSRQKVWRIIKRLEKKKIIWGYAAIINDEKLHLHHYIILIKRTTLPIDEQIADIIVSRQLDKIAPKLGVTIESSYYVHGLYDWVITINAQDIKQAKKFGERLNELYKGYIADLYIIETLFPIKKQGILNPRAIELKQFL